MPRTVLVAGLGAHGSQAAMHLARRGFRVVGFDRFTPPHAHGSTHGGSRIIREAYWESPAYVPLLQRAFELWHDLEEESGKHLFWSTGGLFMGPPGGEVVTGMLGSAAEHDLDVRHWDAQAVRERYPQFALPEGWEGVLEMKAGALHPEASVTAALSEARKAGAVLRADEPVRDWRVREDGHVTARTDRGEYDADALVLATGAWTPHLLGEDASTRVPLRVERRTQFLFDAQAHADRYDPARCPVYGIEDEDGDFVYGFPDLGHGVKLAFHHRGPVVEDADHVPREVRPEEKDAMRAWLARFMPGLADTPVRDTLTCLYTLTPDKHFVLDRHPDHANVVLASACSGHGFKFASVVGEVVADLVESGESGFDLAPFAAGRFS